MWSRRGKPIRNRSGLTLSGRLTAALLRRSGDRRPFAHASARPAEPRRFVTPGATRRHITIAIGGIAVGIQTTDEGFLRLLEDRYAGFLDSRGAPDYEFEIDLTPRTTPRLTTTSGCSGRAAGGCSNAEISGLSGIQSRGAGASASRPIPYSIDAVLRIVHTLVLAPEGGFLVHGASAIRNGRGLRFRRCFGAEEHDLATCARRCQRPHRRNLVLAQGGDGYVAYGTPFAGELAKAGENLKAPVAAVLSARAGPGEPDRRGELQPRQRAALLANILFFAEDAELVQAVFQSALDFVERVPVRGLTFVPDARVWELIR